MVRVRHIYSLCAVVRSQSDFGYINTMFVQVFVTFSAFRDFWLTTLSNLWIFYKLIIFFLFYTNIYFFWYKCVVFAVRGILVLRVQKYQEIETCVMLGNNDFSWWMMAILQANFTLMSHFSSCLEVKFGLLPFLRTVLHHTIYKFVFKL